LGIFQCLQPQALRNVPIHQALAVLVVSGRKTAALGERRIEVIPGELLLLPGGCTAEVGNHPSQAGEPYLGLALVFAQDSIDQFRRNYGAEIPDYTKPVWSAVAPKDMLTAMAQWIEWCAGEICQRLGIGQSTLRRRLNEEGAGFRQLLEESRMVVTLALLQEIFTHTTQYLFAAATLALTPLILGFELTSSDIQTGKPMPKTPEYQGFDCDRANISPQLSWRDAPPRRH
jgi:AraC-like DNA-binding protein